VVIVVVDYEAGNLKSVETALRSLGASFSVSSEPRRIATADRVILPGVGDARAAMARLRDRNLDEALRSSVASGTPFLGICLGSQIVLDHSEENDASCLGIIPGRAVAFAPRGGRKIPHMGWNTVEERRSHPLFTDIPDDASFYFVHSYYPAPAEDQHCFARCEYGETFCAVVGRDNVVATQFHPEKSGRPGLQMLQNFLDWRP
jgi:glutamine amidotransferase